MDLDKLKTKYRNMPIDELAFFLESYNKADFEPEVQKIINEVLEIRRKELKNYVEKETSYELEKARVNAQEMLENVEGIAGMTNGMLKMELQRGGKFVIFQYCISIIIMTFRRPSKIFFIKYGDGTFMKSAGYSLISLLLGWWGIPWGPIYTIGSLVTNIRGGEDMTDEVMAALTIENTPADSQSKEPRNILQCDNCIFSCDLEDFNSNQLFCPECGSRLNLEIH
jgi:hypothetical protein